MTYEIKYLETGIKTTVEADEIHYEENGVVAFIGEHGFANAQLVNPRNILITAIEK
jgi:hypothetical protein